MDRQAYTVGWICAVKTEYVAACELLDEEYAPLPSISSHDSNAYTLGRIGDHHIVVACLPKGRYGIASAATVAKDMRRSFESIRIGLMVGIAGGAPNQKHDIRLGDVVVGCPVGRAGGVLPYKYGKEVQKKEFEITGSLNSPPTLLLTALNQLDAIHERKGHHIAEIVRMMVTKNQRVREKYKYPGVEKDRWYEPTYIHVNNTASCNTGCDHTVPPMIQRQPRSPDADDPVVHYGIIASADQLMKDAVIRDKISQQHDVMCFEMEAAGLSNDFPCVVIRGICDYSDTHKNDEWQGYAAATAAAYAKELLQIIPRIKVAGSQRAVDVVSEIEDQSPAKICDLPDSILSSYFTGRGDELQQINRAFSTSSGDPPARCAIYGMPGVGKTQLALRFASLAFERSQYPYIFWVSAASVEKLTRGFSKLVDLLRLPGRYTSDQVTKLTVARAWLEDPTAARSWLVVLDNVTQETSVMLRDILPRRNSEGKLLFTTRTKKIADVFIAPGKSSQLALQPPGIGDAVAMLSAGAGIERESGGEASYADIEQVVRSVGNLPLAIDQAASYMRDNGSSPQEVLDVYESEEVMEILSWENDLSRHEEKSVAATFTPAVNKIQGTAPDALTLLRILCFCDPENIPMSIFTQKCGALHQEDRRDIPPARARNELEAVMNLFRSPIRLSKAIQAVQRLSLAVYTLEGSERIMRIHDLVQLLLRSKLMADTERRQWLEAAIRVVCVAFEEIGDRRSPRNWSRCGQFISHIESLEALAKQYRLQDTGLLDASTWATVYLDECGLYRKAANWNERIWEQKKIILGENHPSTLNSMANLASTYWNQGRWKEAEELEVRVMEIKKRVLGEEHPDTLRSMNNLASTYWNQGRWKEAEELDVRVMEMRKRVLGEEHPNTLNSMANLASTYWNQGRWKEAEELEVRVIETRKRVLGEEHPDTLSSMGNLAATYWNQERWKEAEELQVRVMKTTKRVLGEEHPDTLSSIANLASIYWSQGRWKEAEELEVRVMETRKRVLGQEHPDTLRSMDNFAFTLKDKGEGEKAVALMEECVEKRKQALGQDHPLTKGSECTLSRWRMDGLHLGSSGKDVNSTAAGE